MPPQEPENTFHHQRPPGNTDVEAGDESTVGHGAGRSALDVRCSRELPPPSPPTSRDLRTCLYLARPYDTFTNLQDRARIPNPLEWANGTKDFMNDGINRLLNSHEIARLGRLALGSRFTVEGTLAGAHRSPLKGFSVEFADYRQYVPGDDLRHLDWRVYGKNERLYIRQYEEECNLRVYLLVDASKSMQYSHDRMSKYRYASKLAGALAYVTAHQQDSVGLTVFDSEIRFQTPARSGMEHLRILANQLTDHTPESDTDVALTLHRLAEKVRRRALVIILSDLFDDLDRVRNALAHFRRRKHDVIVYHVLDRAEIEFPFRDIGNFEDLETSQHMITNPREIRSAYQEAFAEFLYSTQRVCAGLDIDYALATTDVPVGTFIRQHLSRRARRGR
jgi:hypothetical protein